MTDQKISELKVQELCAKARAEIQGLRPYQPGKPIDELAREFGLNTDDIVKLASNENPTGPSKKAIAAIEKEARELTRYPDGNGFELKQALSSKLSSKNTNDAVVVKPENITLGNGSSDILDFIVKCFVGQNEEVVFFSACLRHLWFGNENSRW
jgi:histidinol-phosphate aminotransferase